MKSIVVDTSVWRSYFAGRVAARPLRMLLAETELVLVHPLVVGELVLGGLSQEEERLLGMLPGIPQAAYADVLSMIRRCKLARRGIGWVDAELVASARVARAELWSLDRALTAVADELDVGWRPVRLTP